MKALISIVVPVYETPVQWLDKCIQSVTAQQYDNWELVIVDDGSENAEVAQLLDSWAARDSRIRVRHIKENKGIAAASNIGIKMARGEYIGFLDHDDELTPDALTWVVWALNKNRDTLWYYSDEDKISPKGVFSNPYFKPDYNPYMLLSSMYTCHFSVYEASVLRKAGGFREGFEGAQDHDLALRLSELVEPEKVVHIQRVLYHWRTIPGSTASTLAAKPGAAIAGRKAVAEALERRNLAGKVTSHPACATLYCVELKPKETPKVSIIIPTRNAFSLLKRCIKSIRAHTGYRNYEIIVIDNQSTETGLIGYLEEESSRDQLHVMKYDKGFNFADMNNMAVESVDSEYVVLVNNDVEILSNGWLEQLVATAEMDSSIVSVGALLLYPDRLVQHGGIILGLGGLTGHAHRYVPVESAGYFGRLCCLQQMSAVTGALMLLRRSAFLEVGGFDAHRYPIIYNDVDLCLRLRQRGFRCLYDPAVQAIHYEAKTRGLNQSREVQWQKMFVADWGELLRKDPFYNPNLALDNEQFEGFRHFPVEQ